MRFNIGKLSPALFRGTAVAALLFACIGAGTARADDTWTQTSRSDFESGALFQLDTSSSSGDVKLAKSGSANYAYALRGKNTKYFWRYDVSTDSWASLALTPGNVKYGGSLAYDGGNYIYAFKGNSSSFWRYDISANSWTTLTSAPGMVKQGGALICNNGYVYALQGNNTKNFWRYDISANTWASMAGTSDYVKEGGALTTDGSNYIYAFQCIGTDVFWRYDISANSWTLMANTPGNVGYGAALTYDNSGYVYALRGKYSDGFWRYDISADSWSEMADTPCSVEWGGALAWDGGDYIYALRGKYTWDFWRYDTSAGSWTSRTHTPATVAYGGALAMGGASYHDSGTLTSSTYDAGGAADFGTISWTATAPAGTSVKFQLASNTDNSTWSFVGPGGSAGAYYTSIGQAVWSGHDGDRYLKYKAYLATADTAKTPVLHDVSVTCAPQIVMPVVATGAADLVEETTATLHGTVTSDGGEACQYRFEYDTDSGETYAFSTAWTGSMTTGQYFSAGVSSLNKGTKYYFRAQVKNSAGTASGAELPFLTKPDEPVDTTFESVSVGDTQVTLSWTKGEGAWKTLICRDTEGFPADRDSGIQVYFDTGTSFTDTGLSPGTTYYYRAWSYVTGSEQWSDWYQDLIVTTTGAPPVPPVAVGGTVLGVNKAQVLAPWLCLFLVVSLAAGGIAARFTRKAG